MMMFMGLSAIQPTILLRLERNRWISQKENRLPSGYFAVALPIAT
jgi:hypothetical protein